MEEEKKENEPQQVSRPSDMCHIPIKVIDAVDGDEPIVIRDKDLVKYIGPLARAVGAYNPNWEEHAIDVLPVKIPFKKEHVLFMFDTVRKYQQPTNETRVEIDYPETVDKDLDFLKDIMTLCQYCECDTLHGAIAYVAAQRLNNIDDVKVIADYFGFECDPNQSILDAKDGWMKVDYPE
ncbi:hypothetical protein CAEBREN_20835 [Caenorhabditis brenneri]|uniref:Uncharacterized protein n=1 Tax=Caenorhabditis brenneri TaxID=135651 RepID=G0MBZ3_CAEBE|nr:hypothetical protein CAEBREN_20835 [Caenorhabditis brenneri]